MASTECCGQSTFSSPPRRSALSTTSAVIALIASRRRSFIVAAARTRPHEALLEQSRTVLVWLQGLPTEIFERPSVLPDWSVRQLAGHLVLIHTGLVRSLDQPSTEPALPIYEFVTRYRRDVEMIMAATLDASADLTGEEVVARLDSAIDDLAARLSAGVQMSQVITTPRGPTTTGPSCHENRGTGRAHRRPQSIGSPGDTGHVAAQRARPVHAYPRRDLVRTAPRALC